MEKVFYFPCAKNSETTGNIVHRYGGREKAVPI